ncbi:MAG: cytochrome c [Acidobacteria bacterium]|nr:cytochrome c [Acidobacteriota bacterium]
MKRSVLSGLAGVAIFAMLALAMDEKEYSKKMKAAGDHMGALRKSFQASSLPDVARHAKAMAEALEGTDGFWIEMKRQDALNWSKEGLVAVKELVQAAEAGHADQAKGAMSKLGGSCKSCHDVHREKLADGTYRIKAQ